MDREEEQGTATTGDGKQTQEGTQGLSVDEAVARLAGGEVAEEGEKEETESGETGEKGTGEETEGEGEGDGDGKGKEEEEEGDGKLPEKAQRILEREIGKKVAKWHEKEEQLLARIEELERVRVEPRQAGASDVLSLSADQLDAEEDRIQGILDFCELHPDGYEADPENKDDRNLTAEQIRKAKVENGRRLREIPRARQVLEQKAASEKVAVEVYPELRRGGADRGVYEAFCRRHPSFRGEPNGLLIVGDMLASERNRREKAEFAAKRKGSTVPAARPLPGQQSGKKPTVAAKPGAGAEYTVARLIADGGTVEAATRLMMERGKNKG